MKKIFMILSIVSSLFMTGCSNTNVNNVLDTISNGIETGINNVSDFISKLATSKPAQLLLKVPNSQYFEVDSYKLRLTYSDGKGIEAKLEGNVYNKTNSTLTFVVDFPIYDLSGNVVDKGYIKDGIYGGRVDSFYGYYSQYRLNRDLRINAEQVRTRVYLNGKLIANTHPQPVKPSTTKKATAPKVQEPKQPVVENSTSPKPRQTRQSISK